MKRKFSNRAPSVKGLFLRTSLIWKATATPCPSFRWWNGGRVGRRGQARSRRRRWPGGPGLRAPAHPTIIVLGMGVLRPWLAEVVSAGHMVLSAVGDIRRNMASGRGRRPDVPNAVIAPQRRGRDRRAPSRQGRASADGPEGSGAQRAGSQRNSVLSRHMRCRTTASLRATATFALRAPIRWARACPQVFSPDGLVIRLSTTLAASNR